MDRQLAATILKFLNEPDARPIILTGARQVGKTFLVRQYVSKAFKNYLEINLEETPTLAEVFAGDLDPYEIIRKLSLLKNIAIDPENTLLFIDEAQYEPRSILSLRYFYEKMPQIRVVLAGSLLEFALKKISVPVGRVNFIHVNPLSFCEYLQAVGQGSLAEYIEQEFPGPYEKIFHDKITGLLKEYALVGGMPKVVAAHVENLGLQSWGELQNQIITAYRADLPKYAIGDVRYQYAQTVFDAAARLVGKAFKFSEISREIRAENLRAGFELLSEAHLITRIFSSSAIPSELHKSINRYKIILSDIGILRYRLGGNASKFLEDKAGVLAVGAFAEQLVGQEMLAASNTVKPEFYFWERLQRGSSAEVDYIVNIAGRYIPIEVKSLSPGRLNSLRMFLETYKSEVPFGIRFYAGNTEIYEGSAQSQTKIISLPLYAAAAFMKFAERLL